jgi:tetratricopeptide (TPR) repeat protein
MKALLTLLLLPLLPLAPQDPKTLSLTLADGNSMRAQVLSVDGETATLRALVLGGSMQVRRPLGDFTPASTFRILEEATRPATYDQHFALAQRAAQLGLIAPAGAQAKAAAAAVAGQPDEAEKVATLRAWAADALEEMTRDAVRQGDLAAARHDFKILSTRLADQRSEEQLDALAAEIEGLGNQRDAERLAARQAKLDSKQREEIARRIQPIQARIGAGDKLYREAVAKSRNTSQSSNLAERAITTYRSAWDGLQDLQKRFPDDADVAREAVAMGAKIQDSAIRAALHAANVLTVQSDYRKALEWCNKILAFDEENVEAKEMRRTIQVAAAAASSQWGWGWGQPVVGGGQYGR